MFPEPSRAALVVPSPTIVTESNLWDGTRETVVSHPTARSTSRVGGGEQSQEYEGAPTQNEENVPAALHRLRDKRNNIEGSHVWREHIGHDHASVDGTIQSVDGRELKCQATRVERRTLRSRGSMGRATSNDGDVGLAANVVTAVESKVDSADRTMILVLDANDAPAYTDGPRVVEMARYTMSERGYLGRWAEVWMVGPTTARTVRIDPA